jgi:hypothetical protein
MKEDGENDLREHETNKWRLRSNIIIIIGVYN